MKQQTTGAWIALNNNRLKIYQDSQIYLKDGDQFEIELFNGETTEVLAKIWLNDELISTSGLILKPGQRFYLDRYIDTNNKFKFSTYDVEDSNAAREAIQHNGKVKVQFFRKQQVTQLWQQPHVTWPNINEPLIPNWQQPWYVGDNTGSPQFGDVTFTTNSINVSYTTTMDSFETGRVDKGEASNQSFESVNMDFDSFAFQTSEYVILPKSTQPVEAKNLRNYCGNCGTRIRKQSWKFCPSCGEALD